MNETVTVGQAIEFIRNSLSDIYPRGEVDGFVKIIFRQLLNYESVDILLRKDNILPEFIPDKIAKVVKDLQKRRPIQYIFGTAYFHGHNFHVDGSTLIPRPETEELVDMIINENPDRDLSVLDCGTGSGCIAISLAIGLKFANVEAIDISEDALRVASCNAAALKAKVRFSKQDILDMPQVSEKYDIIVSNPPYIGECERSSMDSNVLDYEPNTALFVPDNDPLVFYRKIAEFGVTALKPNGRIYYEINSRFPEEMRSMMTKLGYLDISVIRDMQGLYRFLIARKEYESEKKVDKQAALEKCAALCARAEHSAYEVRKKMLQWGLPKNDIDEVVCWLYDSSFIDDSRFAHAYARDKALFDCWGKLKIRHGLRVHGISSTLIDEALAEIDEKEYVATLQRLLKHKNSLLREDDAYKRKSALYRYGTTRGFESALVVKHLNALVKGGEDFEEW